MSVRRTFSLLVVAVLVALIGALPGSRAGAAPKSPPGDPPGNNGTVKIERDGPASLNKGNEPHVDGCIFWLEYYGFDKDQTAAITFTSQAPSTPANKVLFAETTKVSDTPAGGGQDRDFVIAYNLTSAVQGLKEHPKQGFHVKLSSDTQGQPGGAKHKVFWIKCTPAPTTTLRVSKALTGTSDATGFGFSVSCNHRPLDTTFTLDAGKNHDITDVPPGTTCAVTETDRKGADAISAKEEPADSVPNDGVVTVGAGPAVVTFTNLFPGEGSTPPPDNSDLRPPAGTPTGGTGGTTDVSGTTATKPDASVLGETATRPESTATLPRTGGDPRPLTTTGLWALGAGGLALLGGRRRRRS